MGAASPAPSGPRVLLLAAGKGERMRPLTEDRPKALLRAGGRTLIDWQVGRLAAAGYRDIVINVAHHGEQVERALGDGSGFGVRIAWSREPEPLETAGAVAFALPLLGPAPFLVVSSDIHTDFDYASLAPRAAAIAADPGRQLAHFVLVENRDWHPAGDMGLEGGRVRREGPRYTYGNISLFHPAMFADLAPGTHLRMFPWAYRFVEEGLVTGEIHAGDWDNVGTPAQLEALDRRLGG